MVSKPRFPIFGMTTQPELELLLHCLRPQPDSTQLKLLAAKPLNWNYLIDLAFGQGVLPLFFSSLEAICPEQVPLGHFERLRQLFKLNLINTLSLSGELTRLAPQFDEAKIPFMVLKGPTLAQMAYGDITLRQYTDLDLVVKESQLEAARKLLITGGFRTKPELTPFLQAKYTRLRYEQDYWKAGGNSLVDLHWSVLPRGFSFSPDPLIVWDKPRQLEVAGVQVWTLSPENLLLYLCAHAAKHDWQSLSFVCDIAWLLHSQPQLDWELVLVRAGKFGTAQMLLTGLRLAQSMLAVPLPQNIIRKIEENKSIEKIAERAQLLMFGATPDSLRRFLGYNLYLKSMESPKDKAHFWITQALQPTPLEWQLLPLPARLYPLYYLLRPLRLGAKVIFSKF
jgi:hypothetical protein